MSWVQEQQSAQLSALQASKQQVEQQLADLVPHLSPLGCDAELSQAAHSQVAKVTSSCCLAIAGLAIVSHTAVL